MQDINLEQAIEGTDYNGAAASIGFYVYIFLDPKNSNVVYVGKGHGYRAWTHLNKSSNPRLHNLIQKRKTEGFSIKPFIVSYFEDEEAAFELEKSLIIQYGREELGLGKLFNSTDGGEGGAGIIVSDVIEFRGKTYPNHSVLCRDFGIQNSVYRTRVKLGWSMAEALEVDARSSQKNRPITVGEKSWPSISKFADSTRYSPDYIRFLFKKNISPEQILSNDFELVRPGQTVVTSNRTFESRAYFARHYQLSLKAVTYWLEVGWTADEILNGEVVNRSAVYTNWRGASITQTEFAAICNLSPTTLIKYRNSNLSNEEIYLLGSRGNASKLGGKAIIHQGKHFESETAFNNEVLGIAKSTLNKWLHQFGFTSSDCLEVLNLAKEINRTKELSWKGCLNFATRLKRKKIKLIRVEGLIVSIAELRRKAKIGQKRLNILLSHGLNGDDIIKWAEENAFSSPKIDSFKFNNKVFKSYAEFDRYAGLPWGKTAYYKRKGFSFDDILELVRITKKLKKSGMETKTAFQRASFELTRKIQGHYIKPSTENYLKFRKLGKPPKEAATLAGVSKSNTSRMEKTLKTRGLL